MAIYEINPFTKEMERVDAKVPPGSSVSLPGETALGLEGSYIPVDATLGDVILTAPSSNQETTGHQFFISKRDSSPNHVIFRPVLGEFVNGAAELRIKYQYSTAHIIADGQGNWMIV